MYNLGSFILKSTRVLLVCLHALHKASKLNIPIQVCISHSYMLALGSSSHSKAQHNKWRLMPYTAYMQFGYCVSEVLQEIGFLLETRTNFILSEVQSSENDENTFEIDSIIIRVGSNRLKYSPSSFYVCASENINLSKSKLKWNNSTVACTIKPPNTRTVALAQYLF